MKRFLIPAVLLLTALFSAAGKPAPEDTYPPHGTYLFAQKGGQSLYMDDYLPAKGSETVLDGREKPAIIFVFGGGFISGTRNDPYYKNWFKALNDNGYRVFSIDYRTALTGARIKGGAAAFNQFYDAVLVSSDDLFSATAYLIAHAEELGIDPGNLVVSGSSAGAMTVLQADWILACRGSDRPTREGYSAEAAQPALAELPEGFRYAGVMSFSGAILSRQGKPDYATPPAPTLFFHGTADKIVNYKNIHVLNIIFAGSDTLARIFRKKGYPFSIYRFEGNSHEIAAAFMPTLPEQLRFLDTLVRGRGRTVDASVDDPDIVPSQGMSNRKDLYNN